MRKAEVILGGEEKRTPDLMGGGGNSLIISKFLAIAAILCSPLFSQAQNVGIGTITPSARLHIEVPSGFTSPVLQVNQQGSATPYLIIQPDGKVGIGVASPSEALDVSGNIQFSGALMPGGNAGAAGQVLVSQGVGNAPVWQDATVVTDTPIVGVGTSSNPIGLQGGTNAGDVLIWDGSQWVIKPAPFDSVCNTAIANYVMKWTGSELCNSIIFDNGSQVGFGTNNPDPSAVVDIQDTLRGFLIPRMTTAQRNAISNPANGLIIYNIDKQCVEFWNGLYWQSLQNCYRPLLDSVLCPTINDSLVGWWTFNDRTATDLSGNGNNGTIFGNPVITCYTNYSQTNCYIQFDGINDYVLIPNSPSIDITGSEITIVAWVMDTDPLGGVAIINKEHQYEVEVRYNITRRLTAAFDTVTNGQNWAWVHTGIEAPLNKWFMVAVVYDGRFIWYYLDGELVSVKENFSAAGPGNPVSGNLGSETHPLRFAARGAGLVTGFRKINIDEVRIYNRALTPEEIKCLYLMGVTHN